MGSWDLLSLRHCFHAVYLDSYPDFRGDYTLDYPKKFKIPTRIINLHQIFGIVAFSLVSLVTILGIFIQVYKIFKGRSKEVVLLKKIHRIAGYIVLVMCKTNSLIITFGGGDLFTILLVVDIATTILIVTWKIFFPKLEARQTSHKVEEPLLTVASLKDLDPQKSYVVFANYVYDVEPLKLHHPAGFQIVEAVKNKEVDRYIYGTCAADELPQVPIWSHSYKSFTMLDKPVAKLQIVPTFEGFDKAQVECQVPKARTISQKGNIFQINLFKKQGFPFRFTKYNNISQLGRYFSVTINDKTTRLYTTVSFLVDENIDFLKKHLRITQSEAILSKKVSSKRTRSTGSSDSGTNEALLQKANYVNSSLLEDDQVATQDQQQRKYQSIPIMFKHYQGGKFSQTVVEGKVKKIFISQSKGQGLQLAQTQPGKILIVAGGTGLFPFSDLIDLLYKEQLILNNAALRSEVVHLSPILKSSPLSNFTFQLLVAFNSVQEIHEVTLQQLLFLAEHKRVKITFKIKQESYGPITEGANVKLVSTSFEEIIIKELESDVPVSKVWICGPPKMNQSISKLLRQRQKSTDFYLIV